MLKHTEVCLCCIPKSASFLNNSFLKSLSSWVDSSSLAADSDIFQFRSLHSTCAYIIAHFAAGEGLPQLLSTTVSNRTWVNTRQYHLYSKSADNCHRQSYFYTNSECVNITMFRNARLSCRRHALSNRWRSIEPPCGATIGRTTMWRHYRSD